MDNVFDSSSFGMLELTQSIENLPYKPKQIQRLGLFEESGVAFTNIAIEELDGVLQVVDAQPRGSAGKTLAKENRRLVAVAVPHLVQQGAVWAESVQNIREFGSNDTTKAVQTVIDRELMRMRSNVDVTLELHRLTAIKGSYIDAANTSQSLYTLFGKSANTNVDLLLGTAGSDIQGLCLNAIEAIEAGLGEATYDHIHAFCGAVFWRKLINHAKVSATYANTPLMSRLSGNAKDTIEFGGIVFERWRGNTLASISDTSAHAFPVGVSGLFVTNFAPATYAETVNTIGLPLYAKSEPMKFNKGVEIEVQSSPITLCTRPQCLQSLSSSN